MDNKWAKSSLRTESWPDEKLFINQSEYCGNTQRDKHLMIYSLLLQLWENILFLPESQDFPTCSILFAFLAG